MPEGKRPGIGQLKYCIYLCHYKDDMPELCRFFGIIIYMCEYDHLPPHFHAKYGEFEAIFSIETGNRIKLRIRIRNPVTSLTCFKSEASPPYTRDS
jgi:hypothetical protein